MKTENIDVGIVSKKCNKGDVYLKDARREFEEGNEITEEVQWAKLALVKEIAKEVFGVD